MIARSLIALLLLVPFSSGGAQGGKVSARHGDDQVIEQQGDLPTQPDPEPRRLVFTIGLGPTADNGQAEIYSTRSTPLDRQQLHGVEGVPVVLSQVRTTERPRLGPWGRWPAFDEQPVDVNRIGWVAFEEVPVDVDSIRLVATVRHQQVTLDVRYRLKRGEQWQIFRTTMSGPLGTWLALLAGPGGTPDGRRAVSTNSGPDRPLNVKVEDARR